jgi:hypothetical protein
MDMACVHSPRHNASLRRQHDLALLVLELAVEQPVSIRGSVEPDAGGSWSLLQAHQCAARARREVIKLDGDRFDRGVRVIDALRGKLAREVTSLRGTLRTGAAAAAWHPP